MKKHPALIAVALLSATLLAGCSTPTAVVLKDGRELQALDEPDFDRDTGFYELKQSDGQRISINKDEIFSIQAIKDAN